MARPNVGTTGTMGSKTDETTDKKYDTKSTESPKAKAKHVTFVSAGPEAMHFDFSFSGQTVNSVRDRSGEKLIWYCPADLADRMRKHHHVVTGRVVEAK